MFARKVEELTRHLAHSHVYWYVGKLARKPGWYASKLARRPRWHADTDDT